MIGEITKLKKRMCRVLYLKTYYQIIMAIQMANTLFKDDDTIIVLTDDSRGTETISEKLRRINRFKKVLI